MLKKNDNFIPNLFIDIDKYIKCKIDAIKSYKGEVKKKPHSRSIEGVKNLSKIRGNQCGVNYAEAYEVIREIL